MSTNHGRRWSIAFGEWAGVPVRLHWLLLLFGVLAVGMTLDSARLGEERWQASGWSGLMMFGVLLVSVVLHEAAHCLAAIRLGGYVDLVVLSPIGGLHSPRVPDEPEPQIFVALIGPMVNLAVAFAAAFVWLAIGAGLPEMLPLLNPVAPIGLLEGPIGMVALKLTIWINWTLLLLNLLPSYPFDGGPALRAVLWPLVGRRTAAVATAYSAQAIAATLAFLAFVADKGDPQAVAPLWAPLVTLAVFLFVSAGRDMALAHMIDESPTNPRRGAPHPNDRGPRSAPWSDEGDEMVLVEHGHEGRRERQLRKLDTDEAYEDARVDDILARLHARGFEHLSDEDRAVLQRASRRYRSRHQDDSDSVV